MRQNRIRQRTGHCDLEDSDKEFQLESEDGQKRLNALKESVGTELREKYPELVDFICVSSLVFRNGDLRTASERVQNYLNWRYKYLCTYEKITWQMNQTYWSYTAEICLL